MSARFDELLPRALDADLRGAEEAEFVALLEDPAHAAAFAELTRVDRELSGLLAAPVSDDTLVGLVHRDLDRGPERGHTTRIVAVLDRVRSRRTTRRISRPAPPASGWWLAAAALFVAAVLIAVLTPATPKVTKETVRVPQPVDPVIPPTPPAPRAPEAPLPAPRPERAPEAPVVPPPVVPKAEVPAPAEVPPAPRPVSPTVVSVARVERAEGQVSVKEGQELLAGHDIDTGADGLVVLRLPDATRVDLGASSQLRGLAGAAEEKRFTLQRGKLSADVAARAAGAKPFVIHTPEAEVAVLGTRFSVSLSPGLTRLDVDQGRVKLARRSDGAAAEVPAGHAAVTGTGIRPVARPCASPGPLVASFTAIDVDSGKPIAGLDPVPDDAVFNLGQLPRINLRANLAPGAVGSVVFAFDGNPNFNVQNGPPFAAYAQGDKGRYQAWTLAPGPHTLTATPFTAARGGGVPGGALTLTFRVR